MKKFLKKSVFLIIAVLLPFVIANEIIRWTWLRNFSFSRFTKKDWDLIYSLRPDFQGRFEYNMAAFWPWQGKETSWQLTVNSQGLRGQKNFGAKARDGFRVICLGDSITFGQDLDDQYTYPFQLEQLLRNSAPAGTGVEVINAGVPAYTSRQGLACLDQRLVKLKPDLVILGFGFNDAQQMFVTAFRPDKMFIPGNVKTGWKKVSSSPVNLVILFAVRQPLFVMIRGISGLIRTIKFMKFIGKIKESTPDLKNQKFAYRPETFQDSRVPPGDFRDNLEQFVWLAKKNHFQLLFYITCRTPPRYREIMLLTARNYGIPVVDFSAKMWGYRLEDLSQNPLYSSLISDYRQKLGDDLLSKNPAYMVSSDGIHPNAVANRIIAEEMAKTIAPMIGNQGFRPE